MRQHEVATRKPFGVALVRDVWYVHGNFGGITEATSLWSENPIPGVHERMQPGECCIIEPWDADDTFHASFRNKIGAALRLLGGNHPLCVIAAVALKEILGARELDAYASEHPEVITPRRIKAVKHAK